MAMSASATHIAAHQAHQAAPQLVNIRPWLCQMLTNGILLEGSQGVPTRLEPVRHQGRRRSSPVEWSTLAQMDQCVRVQLTCNLTLSKSVVAQCASHDACVVSQGTATGCGPKLLPLMRTR
jgi:hypothetical protein